ncbi:acyl-CoA carboxylase epsilon subunit [Kitasatospora sp. NPDC101157]|uniref:acyl-CoA carboxylase epsilon subunit n=1 Tax=Kitasatospora sp. NPDC101157 TaxID=3364098 RepID=UPI0038021ED9
MPHRTPLFRTDRTDLTPEEIATLTLLLLNHRGAQPATRPRPAPRRVRWHDVSLKPPTPTTSWHIVA